ncbi:2OG-Fe(II) oxygenase [Ruegeria sp. Ofav3-42]|uniref:HalD/BesD family halogenase n=1 Tax=Ruegeria sp. Ofav3-42 TaxID=2917759 RepID=UPI001EF750E1|nr:2OG-Fe(II) oxygenase [Ruegeria sp. Ofav3-42]MCG7519883.1 2OG-Fe(II) oxygenase [Ruegeria sp. Ofav3-42]
MRDVINLDLYPLDQPGSVAWQELIEHCKLELTENGLFNLPGFIRDRAIQSAVAELKPVFSEHSFVHARRHNIYFKKSIDGLNDDHPALIEFETSNRTICADRMGQSTVIRLYEWPPFAQFLAAVMEKPELFVMQDPLARVNVMAYAQGQALNWHFDRSEFTTTLLLQAPDSGGDFEYEKDLRSDVDPNYDGVADLLEGRRKPTLMKLQPGTLNIFKGKNTAHRVTPVRGERDRIIAVFSYYERPNVQFTEEERIGFYGRAS